MGQLQRFLSWMHSGAQRLICECASEIGGGRGFSEDKHHVTELLKVEAENKMFDPG